MKVAFENAVVLNTQTGVSKNGNQYGVIEFLSDSLDIYKLFVFGEQLTALERVAVKGTYNLAFELRPAARGGVHLVPAW